MAAEGQRVHSKWLVCTGFIAGCGGAPKHAGAPGHVEIALVPTVAAQAWYRSAASCAQGPYELEVPIHGAKYGEDVELRLHAPHAIELHAVLVLDGQEATQASGVYDSTGGLGDRRPDNARCVASAEERLQLARGGGGAPGSGGVPVGPAPGGGSEPAPQAVSAPLEAVVADVAGSTDVIHFRVPAGHASATIKLWSIEPNDLDGVLFGIADITWAPNVPEAQYEAHLRAEADAAARAQAEAQRRADEEWRREQAHARVVVVDPAAEARAREQEERARLDAQRRAEEAERRRIEAERRAAIAAALEAERARQRAAFCDAHPEDRDCWGAGGRRMHDALDAHAGERAAYCAGHAEDARCWSDDEWSRRRAAWDARVAAALEPPKPPDGPPPAPLAEQIPPKLSVHAEWRPGYWQWTEAKWVWLAGMWRVPESDIAAEQTTIAPQPPPPLRTEAPPPPPVTVAVWVGGFWQWSGSAWVWIPGSWQLRPDPRASWRAPEWRVRGAVHVLIPGGWVHP